MKYLCLVYLEPKTMDALSPREHAETRRAAAWPDEGTGARQPLTGAETPSCAMPA
jgi:hypothetical protein